MARESKRIGNCPECHSDQFTCSYNHFEKDELRIDSWEHKCPNCGFRETRAFRTDEEEDPEVDPVTDVDPCVCPFCDRRPA